MSKLKFQIKSKLQKRILIFVIDLIFGLWHFDFQFQSSGGDE